MLKVWKIGNNILTKNINFSLGLCKKNANNYENFEAEISEAVEKN